MAKGDSIPQTSLVNFGHQTKEYSFIVVMELGIVTVAKFSQPINKCVSMVVKELGKVKLVNPEPLNADFPIAKTELGITTEAKFLVKIPIRLLYLKFFKRIK